MSEETTGKTVHFTPDPSNPPRLTAEQQQRLDSMRDEDIDLSDIPSQAGKPGWHPGLYGPGVAEVRRAALRQGLLLLDEDVVESFRKIGDVSPQRMNAVLREYAERQKDAVETASH